MINNPVLRGFHADPSMICVDGVFYVANSTFEYYPGVKISMSKDLANWETLCYPLKNLKHIQLKGNPQSTGIWAPCLSYHNGLFYLVYTDVKQWMHHPFKDAPNYITYTTDLLGQWSDPVYINSSGFDPSLFHDDDGKKYFVNMEWDYRTAENKNFTGILLTELDPISLKPITSPKKIYEGTDRGLVEGPHLYKKDGWYYLFTAEGGTSYEHAETVARSKNIDGLYETHPNKHIITTDFDRSSPIQKTGHASLCQHSDGRWWLAFLCGRPIDDSLRCPLGRETGVAEVIWENDWPFLKSGGYVPAERFHGYGVVESKEDTATDFTNPKHMIDFQSLRVPAKYDLLPNGGLRLYGGESLLSTHEQNMLVRRQDAFDFSVTMSLEYNPTNFQQMAGIIYRYNEENQYFLRVSFDEKTNSRMVGLLKFDKYRFEMLPTEQEINVENANLIWLKVDTKGVGCTFSCSTDGVVFSQLPIIGDVTILSDEYATPLGFTGAFIGMACIDMDEKKSYADIKSFLYQRQ